VLYQNVHFIGYAVDLKSYILSTTNRIGYLIFVTYKDGPFMHQQKLYSRLLRRPRNRSSSQPCSVGRPEKQLFIKRLCIPACTQQETEQPQTYPKATTTPARCVWHQVRSLFCYWLHESHPTSEETGLTSKPCRRDWTPPVEKHAANQSKHAVWTTVRILLASQISNREKPSMVEETGGGGSNHMVSPTRCPSGSHKGNMEAKATTCPRARCPLTHSLLWILF